jgi:heme/copper-type cytochrome/quinol oxidase subunit 3
MEAKPLQEQRNVKWILIISIIMLPPSIVIGVLLYPPYYYQPYTPDPLATLTLFMNRASTLLFIATVTTATLATAGLPRKNAMITVSVYLFTAAMALLFITMLKLLFTFPSAT